MAEFIAGPTMVLNWLTGASTTVFAADYRAVTWNPSTAYAEVTAGSDTQVGRLPTIKDATCAVELVGQAAGTALATVLQPQQAGTLIIQPEGTAVGKRKITFPCFCDGAQIAYPYADVVSISANFSGSSTLGSFTDASN
jgi:hypothetical protein